MIDTPNKLSKCNVGDRIECQGYYGTIKYIGEVTDFKGLWLGVNWDDPSRGKHNGTVNGIQYFVASSDTSGSFIRLEKVQLGQSIITAITSRYGSKDEDDITSKQQMFQAQHSINVPIEFVGFSKITDIQGNYNNLKVVNVRFQTIKFISDPDELKNLCPNIAEIDISKNLINSWSHVFQICTELEQLNWINISENRLVYPENYNFNFPKLKTLICGSMELTWDDISKLGRIFPNIEEIIAANNHISNIILHQGELQHIKRLDLENNSIMDWSNLYKLGILKNLEELNVECTGISQISFKGDGKTELFPKLNSLNITNNMIHDWMSIGELNKLQNLKSLKCKENPVFRLEQQTYQQIVIARIQNLEYLNGAEIQDRKGAEYDYLKKYGIEWLEAKLGPQSCLEFLAKHNRYQDLIDKYGDFEESEVKVQVKTIQATLIEIQLVYGETIILKKIPPSILIQKLILLAQRLFKLNVRPKLVYICRQQPNIEFELDDSYKELGVYSIENGDKIIVKT